MDDKSERRGAPEVARPAPPQDAVDRLRAWVGWFGLGRLVAAAVSMVIVCVGAFWLVRAPTPPADAVLPRVSAATAPASTLVPPVSRAPVVDVDAGASSEVVVHVAGAVAHPGVYRLRVGQRIDDAVRVAGGATVDADLDALNLAAVLVDGVRVHVPVAGEVIEPIVAGPTPEQSVSPPGPIDLNRADATQLDTLPGVGPATAAAIVAERERNGPFLGVDDLARVPGIGPAKLAGLRDLVIA